MVMRDWIRRLVMQLIIVISLLGRGWIRQLVMQPIIVISLLGRGWIRQLVMQPIIVISLLGRGWIRQLVMRLIIVISLLGIMGSEVYGNVFNNWDSKNWGSFSQSFMFDLHSITRSRYYQQGDLIYQYESDSQRGEEVIGQDYVFESRTAYYYRYVTVMFVYAYEERLVKYFNSLEVERPLRRQSRGVHRIMPQVYFTYEPLRLGLSYYEEFSSQPAFADEQTWSLRGERALSFHVQLYFAKIPSTPLGITLLYEFAFDPSIPVENISTDYFQRIGLNLDIYFTHYSQFKLGITYANSTEDVTLQNADVTNSLDGQGNLNYEVTRDERTRYYIDYIFIYRFTNLVSMNIMMGQMVYANFESPAYRFKVGVTYHYGH